MGTRISFLGWVPYQGLGTPSFPTSPSMRATVINHARDRDWRASTVATGRRIVPSIPESRLGRAWGCFSGQVGDPGCTRDPAARGSQLGEVLGQEPRRPGISTAELIQHRRRFRRGFAAGAILGNSTRAFIPMLEKSPIHASVKAKEFRHLLSRMVTVLLLFVGVSKTIAQNSFMTTHRSMSLTSALFTSVFAIGISFWLLAGCVPVVPPPSPPWPPPSYPNYSSPPPPPEPEFSLPPARPEPPMFEKHPLPPATVPEFSVPSRPPIDLHPGGPKIEEPLPKAEEPPPPPKQPDQPPEWVNPPPMDENP